MATSLWSCRRRTVVLTKNLAGLGRPLQAEAPGIDAVEGAILAVAGPTDRKVARGVHGHGGLVLQARRVLVDQELVAFSLAELIVDAGVDPRRILRSLAGPDDHKVAGGVHGHGRR